MARHPVAVAGLVVACISCTVKPTSVYKRDFKSLLAAELSVRGLAIRGSSFAIDNRRSLRHTRWHTAFSGRREQAMQVFAWFKDTCEQAIIDDGGNINGRGKGKDQTHLSRFNFDYSSRGHQGTVYSHITETSDEGTSAIFFLKLEN